MYGVLCLQPSSWKYLIQDVVPLFPGGYLNELPQEEWGSLGDGRQLRHILHLALQAGNLGSGLRQIRRLPGDGA